MRKGKNEMILTKFFWRNPEGNALVSVTKQMQDELEWQAEQNGRRITRFDEVTVKQNQNGGWRLKLVAHIEKVRK